MLEGTNCIDALIVELRLTIEVIWKINVLSADIEFSLKMFLKLQELLKLDNFNSIC